MAARGFPGRLVGTRTVGVRKVAWGPSVPRVVGVGLMLEVRVPEVSVEVGMTPEDSPSDDSAPPAAASAPGGAGAEPSLSAAWARSAAFTYFVILSIAALAIGLGWPVVEWAFDTRRLFR